LNWGKAGLLKRLIKRIINVIFVVVKRFSRNGHQRR
jgi:hypothetical protein